MQQAAIIDFLKTMPAFAEAMRQHEEVGLAERQARIDELADFRRNATDEQARLAAEVSRLEGERALLRTRLDDLNKEHYVATSQAMWHANKTHRKAISLEAAILAGADPQLAQFRAWVDRAGNLVRFASHEPTVTPRDPKHARTAVQLCAAAVARVDEMRREAIGSPDVALELDQMAHSILEAFDSVRCGMASTLPRDWRAPLY